MHYVLMYGSVIIDSCLCCFLYLSGNKKQKKREGFRLKLAKIRSKRASHTAIPVRRIKSFFELGTNFLSLKEGKTEKEQKFHRQSVIFFLQNFFPSSEAMTLIR